MNASEQKVELLACPFCGGAALFSGDFEFDRNGYTWCTQCPCAVGERYSGYGGEPDHVFETKEAAAEAWNKRAINQSAIASAREALKRIIDMCDVPSTCTCGRPTGLGAVVSCAKRALAQLEGK
jgi:hypothetical protein